MKWDDIKEAIAKSAPMAGTLLGGARGEVIGSMIASALGVEPTPNAVAEAMKNDPEAGLKLAQLESNERVAFREMSVALVKAAHDDRADARAAHTASPMPSRIVYLCTVLVLVLLFLIWNTPLQPESKTMATLLLGHVLTKWSDAISYFVGTSHSSATKTQYLTGRG